MSPNNHSINSSTSNATAAVTIRTTSAGERWINAPSVSLIERSVKLPVMRIDELVRVR